MNASGYRTDGLPVYAALFNIPLCIMASYVTLTNYQRSEGQRVGCFLFIEQHVYLRQTESRNIAVFSPHTSFGQGPS